MPDDDATRSRRYRRHKAGDHSMCQHDRHGPVLPALRAIPAPEPEGELDSRAELVLLARQLAAAYSADPSNVLNDRSIGYVRCCRCHPGRHARPA